MSPSIFISYRRGDSNWSSELLFTRLIDLFGEELIFHDANALEAGDEFETKISSVLNSCDVVLTLIGPNWTGSSREEKSSRLFEESDWVRREIEMALARKIVTIPILFHPAKFPESSELPPSIANLVNLQYLTIYPGQDFDIGFQKLTEKLFSVIPDEKKKGIPQPKPPRRVARPPLKKSVLFIWILSALTLLQAIYIISIAGRNFAGSSSEPENGNEQFSKISYVRNSNDFLPNLPKLLEGSKKSVWFFGTNFHITAGDRKNDIISALERGVQIRFLVLDPESPDYIYKQMESDFGQNALTIRAECESGLSKILDLKETWDKSPLKERSLGEIEIRVYSHYPWARMYLFDSGLENGSIYYVPYFSGLNSSDVPGLLLENSSEIITRMYQDAITAMWRDSKPVSSP